MEKIELIDLLLTLKAEFINIFIFLFTLHSPNSETVHKLLDFRWKKAKLYCDFLISFGHIAEDVALMWAI